MTTPTPEFIDSLDISAAMLDRYRLMRSVRRLPRYWIPVGPRLPGYYQHAMNGLRVIESLNVERDEKCWHHVSCSRAARVPDWDDMKLVRQDFIGDDRESYMVLPPAERYVNTHLYTLHLWCCLDAPDGVLPDFRHMGQI
jgi:hypothetical protein